MKKILIILFILPLIFSSCEKEDDTPDSNSNNPIGNIPTGTTGYFLQHTGSGNYDILKTTDSGVNWVLQSTGNYFNSYEYVDFVD